MSWFFFYSLLLFAIIFGLSSANWLSVWFAFELNMCCFVLIVALSNMNKSFVTPVIIKYFLFQSPGSGIFLAGVVLTYMVQGFWFISQETSWANLMILLGLSIKVGLSPFHVWLPDVMSSMSWDSCAILATAQKVMPLVFIYSISESAPFEFLVLSALVGGFGGLNQTNLRTLMGYSSIGHLAWLISIGVYSFGSSVLYFFVYMITCIYLFSLFNSLEFSYFKSCCNDMFNMDYLIVIIFLLSLGGMPPFVGFFAKWIGFNYLCIHHSFLLSVLVLGSLLSLFYYLCIFLNLMFIGLSSQKKTKSNNLNLFSFLFFSLTGVVLLCCM